jgi:periplasmic copper chaperone A
MTRKTMVAVAAMAIGAWAAPAHAHVSVNPDKATKGSVVTFAFRVPNERPDSGTTKLEVSFPVEHPFQRLEVQPVPGWTHMMERQKLATPIKAEQAGEADITDYVAKVTWEGGTIAPGEIQEFAVSGGPLPVDAEKITFKAVQTYASGEKVFWIEEETRAGEELEHPAPVLQLVADGGQATATPTGPGGATDTSHTGPVEEASPTTAVEEEQQAGTSAEGDDGGSNGLGVFALVAAGVALVLLGGGLIRRRNPVEKAEE